MATPRVEATANPMAGLASLLTTLGGSRTTSNPGDITALQGLLGQLQGADYSQLLQSVFQQAAGQIPGFQSALGRSIGARSGNNSAVQAALSELLKQTTLAGQEQITRAQLQNQQLQAQAGSAIAQATRGTTQKTGADLGNAARLMAGLQIFGKVRGMFDEGDPIAKIGQALGLSPTPTEIGTLPSTGLDLSNGPVAMDGMISEPQLPADFDQPLDTSELFPDFSGYDSSNIEGSPDFMGPPLLPDDYSDFDFGPI